MFRLLLLSFLQIVSLSLLSGLAQAESDYPSVDSARRIALVIGNGAYIGEGALANPVNDANDMAARLRQLGFEVMLRTDADYKAMRSALTDFGRQVKKGTVALFF